jgi:hypothetical protein
MMDIDKLSETFHHQGGKISKALYFCPILTSPVASEDFKTTRNWQA